MTLPTSGIMTSAMINQELGRSATSSFSINGVAERALAEVPNGSIAFSDFYGKSDALLKTTITIQRYYTTRTSYPEPTGNNGGTGDITTSHGWLYGLYRLDSTGFAIPRAFAYKSATGGSIADNNVSGRVIRNLLEMYSQTTDEDTNVGFHPSGSADQSWFQIYGENNLNWNTIIVGNTTTTRITGGEYSDSGYLGKDGRFWINGVVTGQYYSHHNNPHILGKRRSGTHLLQIEE